MTNAFTMKVALVALLMDTSPTAPITWPTTTMSTAWYTYCSKFTAMSGSAKARSCRNSGPSVKERGTLDSSSVGAFDTVAHL